MFRSGSELAAQRAEKNPDVNFTYSLQSLWPINKQNEPTTDAKKEGLQYIFDNKVRTSTPPWSSATRSTSRPSTRTRRLPRCVSSATTSIPIHPRLISRSVSRVSLVIPRASILLREDSVLGDNLASSRIRPAVAAAPDFPLVRRARQRPHMAQRRVGCALHVASAASGLSPLRHCGNTPAPTPIRD